MAVIDAMYTIGSQFMKDIVDVCLATFRDDKECSDVEIIEKMDSSLYEEYLEYFTRPNIIYMTRVVLENIKRGKHPINLMNETYLNPGSIYTFNRQRGFHWKSLDIIIHKKIKKDWGIDLNLRRMPLMLPWKALNGRIYSQDNRLLILEFNNVIMNPKDNSREIDVSKIDFQKTPFVYKTQLLLKVDEEEAIVPDKFEDGYSRFKLMEDLFAYAWKESKEYFDLMRLSNPPVNKTPTGHSFHS
jgi:hypothetical protein